MTIEEQVKSLRRTVRALGLMWVVTIAAFVTIAASSRPSEIVAKRIAVIDEKGVERVVISAPAPDPVVAGARVKRDGQISGVIIYDAAGNERGGYGTADGSNSGAMITLDSADGQVFLAYANPLKKDGGTIALWNEKGDSAVMTAAYGPVFQMTRGKDIIFKHPPNAPEIK